MRHALLPLLLAPVLTYGQAVNPLAIPPALDLDTFDLVVDEHVHQFYPGLNTATYGVSAEYLGPTVILHTGDTARFRVHNDLAQVTNMHWHGLRVPGPMDGGPPREIAPGEELTLDYHDLLDGESESFECRCGATGCRGTVQGIPGNSVTAREARRTMGGA